MSALADSATLHRWYENWMKNEDKVKATYGDKWYRVRPPVSRSRHSLARSRNER